LTYLRIKKSRLYRKFKDTGSQSIYYRYFKSRSSFTVLNSLCYKNNLNRCKVKFSENPRKFLNFVNTKRKSTNNPSLLSFISITATTDSDSDSRSFCQVFSNHLFYFISFFTFFSLKNAEHKDIILLVLNFEFNFVTIGRLYHIAAIGTIGKLVGK